MGQTHTIGRVATSIRKEKFSTIVRYHQTDVVQIETCDGLRGQVTKVTLRSGGWRTLTTKARMNQTANQFGLNFEVFQRNFEWFVQLRGFEKGTTMPFEEGMEFYI